MYLFHVSFTYRGEQAARLTHGAQIAQQAQEEHDGADDEQSIGQLLNDLWLCKVLQERERERERRVESLVLECKWKCLRDVCVINL